jgi:hypothetical protein
MDDTCGVILIVLLILAAFGILFPPDNSKRE